MNYDRWQTNKSSYSWSNRKSRTRIVEGIRRKEISDSSELRLLASARSKDSAIVFNGKSYPVQEPCEEAFRGIDIMLALSGEAISKEFAPMAVKQGA